MLKNYLRVSLRNIYRNKFISVLNILGLSLGMVFSLIILIWVKKEFEIDTFHSNQKNLYTVYERIYNNNDVEADYETPGILAEELKRTEPDIQYAVSFSAENEEAVFRVKDKVLKQEGVAAGSDLFKMFSYKIIQGSADRALNSPDAISISEKMAKIFFGSSEDAIGKTLFYENKKNLIIKAVFKDIPENSSRKFDYVTSWDAYLNENSWAKRWDNTGPLTYVMLRANASAKNFEEKIKHFRDIYYRNNNSKNKIEYGIQNYSDVYLHSSFKNGNVDGGRIDTVNLFIIIAFFVLLIACINFMNLTTALSVKRSKEIGIRKVAGALRPALITQFIFESLFQATLSAFLGLLLLCIFLPTFNYITQERLSFPFFRLSFWLETIGLTILMGGISGIYPALFLSSFNPVKVINGSVRLGRKAIIFRKALVIFQFSLSIILIISTIIVSKQVNFIQKKNIGYDRHNLIYIPLNSELAENYKTFKNEALNIPGIISITRISNNPTNLNNSTTSIEWEGKDINTKIPFSEAYTGYDLVQTMKLKIVAGRDFSPNFPTDSQAYIVNETAISKMGYKDPIGKPISLRFRKGPIIGVIKDFHFKSLQEKIDPLILIYDESNAPGNLIVRVTPEKSRSSIGSLADLFKKLNPNIPFSYTFSDEEFEKLYKDDQLIGKLSDAFAFLAIFISSLGLLGLAIFTAEQRMKEISIRKVLGANVSSLFRLMSKEFIYLIIIAFLVASPIAWVGAYKWLHKFAYHTTIDWWIFLLSAIVVMAITLITVSYHSLKAARSNPIKTLKVR